jgi:hypothetical protein
MELEIGRTYNWRGQPERMIYQGKKGLWHQFTLRGIPSKVWCEVLDEDLRMIKATYETAQEEQSCKS